jgi:hypothetical protein
MMTLTQTLETMWKESKSLNSIGTVSTVEFLEAALALANFMSSFSEERGAAV